MLFSFSPKDPLFLVSLLHAQLKYAVLEEQSEIGARVKKGDVCKSRTTVRRRTGSSSQLGMILTLEIRLCWE